MQDTVRMIRELRGISKNMDQSKKEAKKCMHKKSSCLLKKEHGCCDKATD